VGEGFADFLQHFDGVIIAQNDFFYRFNESVEKANLRKLACSPLYGSLYVLVWGSYFDSAVLSF